MRTDQAIDELPAPGLPSPANLEGMEETTKPIDYGAVNAAYVVLLAGVVAAQQRWRKEERIASAELLPLGAATFALSKVIAREKIGTWVREPFVDETAGRRRVRGRRLRRAVGELVTCTRCVGAWSSLGIVGLRLMHPPTGRVVSSVLATSALNDFLHAAFQAICGAANERGSKR